LSRVAYQFNQFAANTQTLLVVYISAFSKYEFKRVMIKLNSDYLVKSVTNYVY